MSDEAEHGIDEAVYAFNGVEYEPMLLCLCGQACRGIDWTEAGAALDDHLRIAKEEGKP